MYPTLSEAGDCWYSHELRLELDWGRERSPLPSGTPAIAHFKIYISVPSAVIDVRAVSRCSCQCCRSTIKSNIPHFQEIPASARDKFRTDRRLTERYDRRTELVSGRHCHILQCSFSGFIIGILPVSKDFGVGERLASEVRVLLPDIGDSPGPCCGVS